MKKSLETIAGETIESVSIQKKSKVDVSKSKNTSKLIESKLESSNSSFWDRFKIDWDSLIIDSMTPVLETAKMNYHIPESTLEAIQEQKEGKTSLYFISTFKSVWDAFMLPHALTSEPKFMQFWNTYKKQKNPEHINLESTGIDMPYVMMSSNINSYAGFAKSYIEEKLKENSRILLIDRDIEPMKYRNTLKNIEEVLSGNNILIGFPEGSRSKTGIPRKFDNSIFIGAINASKNHNVKIIPVNVDYSGILDIAHLVNGSNYLKMLYSGAMNRRKMKFGRVYLTMGRPIDLKPDMLLPEETIEAIDRLKTYDRKKSELSYRLAEYTQKSCLNLVRIQPVNVVAETLLRINPSPWKSIDTNSPEFFDALSSTIYDYDNHSYKFKRFDKLSSVSSIIKKSKIQGMMDRFNMYGFDSYITVSPKMLKELKLYSNHIKHYYSKSDVYESKIKPMNDKL